MKNFCRLDQLAEGDVVLFTEAFGSVDKDSLKVILKDEFGDLYVNCDDKDEFCNLKLMTLGQVEPNIISGALKIEDPLKTVLISHLKLSSDMFRCMTGFMEAVRNVTGTPYPWEEEVLVTERFEELKIDNFMKDLRTSGTDVVEESELRDISGLKTLDSWLDEEGFEKEVSRAAQKRVDEFTSEHPNVGDVVNLSGGKTGTIVSVHSMKMEDDGSISPQGEIPTGGLEH